MKDQADQATLWPVEVHEARSMGGFGERMQREREMRSIALEEIAESTKISCRMLRALEEEDFEKLPGGIFNKGFVRAYAKFLGIDEEQAVIDYQAAVIEKQQKQPTNGNGFHSNSEVMESLAAAAERERSEPQPDQAAGFMRAAVIIVCVLGIGGLAWKFWWNRQAAPLTQPSTPVQTLQSAAPPSNASVAPPTNPAEGAVPPPSTGASDKDSAADKKPPETEDNGAAVSPNASLLLQITWKERSWVQVTGDGKLLMESELPASTTRSFRAAKQLVVKLGNAPGVEISYNGKPLPQFAADQKTRTLTFTPEGVLQ